MGGFERKGQWIVPRHLRLMAVMGGGELDLRDAKLSSGVAEIEIFTMWGGVEILVPDGVRVDVSGMVVMGGFSASGGSTREDPNAPVLRVSGLAIMGGVDVRRKDRGKKSEKRYIEALERAEQLRTREARALVVVRATPAGATARVKTPVAAAKARTPSTVRSPLPSHFMSDSSDVTRPLPRTGRLPNHRAHGVRAGGGGAAVPAYRYPRVARAIRVARGRGHRASTHHAVQSLAA